MGGDCQELKIPGPLPGLNQIIEAAKEQALWDSWFAKKGRKKPRAPTNTYSAMKRQWGGLIKACIKVQAIRPVPSAFFEFEWREKDRRRDPDNVAAGGRKLILDGLTRAGIIRDDGWKHVAGWKDSFVVDKAEPGVVVRIREQKGGE